MKHLVFDEGELTYHHTYTESPCESDFPLHAHDAYEIYCFIQGQGYYTVEGHDYPLSPGCILIMRDGETHKLHISPDKPYERIALQFSPRPLRGTPFEGFLSIFKKRPLGSGNMLPPTPELWRVVDMFAYMTSQDDMDEQTSKLRVTTYLPALLYELYHIKKSQKEQVQVDGKDTLVQSIIEYINHAPHKIQNVVAMESIFGYSRSYLNRVFRNSTGVPIWDYVILKRLTMARKMVRAGITPSKAAQKSGFVDYSSFFRQYRKRFGLTPEEDKRAAMEEGK